jgi:hypothetical protein
MQTNDNNDNNNGINNDIDALKNDKTVILIGQKGLRRSSPFLQLTNKSTPFSLLPHPLLLHFE